MESSGLQGVVPGRLPHWRPLQSVGRASDRSAFLPAASRAPKITQRAMSGLSGQRNSDQVTRLEVSKRCRKLFARHVRSARVLLSAAGKARRLGGRSSSSARHASSYLSSHNFVSETRLDSTRAKLHRYTLHPPPITRHATSSPVSLLARHQCALIMQDASISSATSAPAPNNVGGPVRKPRKSRGRGLRTTTGW